MKRLLWCGDAAVSSGFARATHYILQAFRDAGWEIHVLGINYLGDPHPYDWMKIYPCWPGKDMFGYGRLQQILEQVQPDLLIVQNDTWNVPDYLRRAGNVPVIAAMAIDGLNVKRAIDLNGLSLGIFWTTFGLNQARDGGYTGPAAVIPLGVDRSVYFEMDRRECRQALGLPKKCWNGFIVGNVNRNQPRKRLDLTVSFFADWIHKNAIKDAYLYLHVAPTGDMGYDLLQLAKYYGIAPRLIFADPDIGQGVNEETMRATYNCFDVQVSTTQGEGWGLTTLEGMACRVPQIFPDWAALGEWAADAAIAIKPIEISTTPGANMIGAIPYRADFIMALQQLYTDPAYRAKIAEDGFNRACSPSFDWKTIGQTWLNAVNEALGV